MPLLTWVRGLPRPVWVAVPILLLALAIGAAALALSTVRRQAARATSSPSPSPSEALASPTPSESASPSPSPSPSPTSGASAAPAPAPVTSRPAGPGCGQPAGGFPGCRLAASTPVALAWSPDGRLFWAERSGAIKVFEGGGVRTFATVSTVTTERGGGYSERGLLGLAISGSLVFAMYSNTDYATQSIVRWTDAGGAATAATLIASGLPAGSDCCYKGGRLAISPDGHLFATIGDNHDAPAAQVPGDLRGKVIRFNLDGSGRTIWTSGLRNPFGIAFAPDGRLFITSNGPSGDAGSPGTGYDTADLVQAGANYQWPVCYGYSHPIGGGACPAGSVGPDYSTEATTIVPTGATWVTSGQYAGHFVFCSFAHDTMKVFLGPRQVQDGPTGCALDVKQGPDGALYFSDSGSITRFAG